MVSSSSSSSTPLGPPVAEKLTRENYFLWKAQVLPAIRGAQLMGYLDGYKKAPAETIEVEKPDKTKETVINSEYTQRVAQGQTGLSYLLNSLSKEVLQYVLSKTTAVGVWTTIETMFSSQSWARVTNLRVMLANAKKGDQSTAAYFSKMRALGDELAAAGKPLEDEELVSHIISGLDANYHPLVSSIITYTEPMGLSDLYAQIMCYDMRLEDLFGSSNSNQFQSSANNTSRGKGGSNQDRGGGCGRGGGWGRGGRNTTPRQGGSTNRPSSEKPTCQICGKVGRTAAKCWYRYDEDDDYQQPDKVAGAASTSYGIDTNWYMDSGASDHITRDIETITVHNKYKGKDQVHGADGIGMSINNIGHSIIHTPCKNLYLKNILHVCLVLEKIFFLFSA